MRLAENLWYPVVESFEVRKRPWAARRFRLHCKPARFPRAKHRAVNYTRAIIEYRKWLATRL
jgi:hypothetical protein